MWGRYGAVVPVSLALRNIKLGGQVRQKDGEERKLKSDSVVLDAGVTPDSRAPGSEDLHSCILLSES